MRKEKKSNKQNENDKYVNLCVRTFSSSFSSACQKLTCEIAEENLWDASLLLDWSFLN